MARLSLSLLGPFQVTLDGRPVTGFESDKVRALLAYLAVEADRLHRRETLAGLLWPERPERSARRNLNQALYNLRRALDDHGTTPPFLTVTRQALQFNAASDCWLDTTVFAALLEDAKRHPHRRLAVCDACLERLTQAGRLYRGSFLEGFSLSDSPAFEEWTLLQRERFQRLVMETLSCLADCHEQRGEYEQALRYARQQVALDPWRESAHRQLMRTLALSGQRAAALAQYDTCRRILAEELAVEPEEETTVLYERIRDGADLLALHAGPPHNLPASLTPFVGREAELARIKERLQDPGCRLLTLFGPGGVGKTRLALEAARDQREGFPHGVYFVSLAPLQSVDAIVPNVAEALGLSFSPRDKPEQQLLDYLRHKTMLLVLDSFEGLLARPERRPEPVEEPGRRDGTDVVTKVLRAASEVKIAVTSRARLNVKGEHLFPVGGMAHPRTDGTGEKDVLRYDAVRLFLDGARRVQPDLNLTEGALAEIAHICRQVQGMPLALLLASAWMEILSPAEIAAEIGRDLDFLAAEWHDLPLRQRSMRAVFDRSWHLLTGQERAICEGLSVFRGGFARGAAQAVTGASLHDLKALVDRSRLQITPDGRYDVHELLRQYAAEKLSRTPDGGAAVRDRHSAHYAAALQRWAADLKTDRQPAALAEMETEIENARTAWNWAVEQGQVAQLDQALEGLCLFYDMRVRHEEGEAVCRLAAQKLKAIRSHDGLRVQARALAWQGHFNRLLGSAELASQLLRESLALLESPELASRDTRSEKAFFLLEMGHIAALTDREEAKRLYEQSLTLYRALDDRWWTANALYVLGMVGHSTSAYPEAQRWYTESLALFRALGDPRGAADALVWLGFNHIRLGQIEEGERLIREGAAVRQTTGDRAGIAFGLFKLAAALTWSGRYAESHALLEECMPVFEDLGLRYDLAYSTYFLGGQKINLGRYEEARATGQTALRLCQEMGYRREVALCILSFQGGVALAEERYAEAQQALGQSVAIYRELGQREELGWALALSGCASRGLGRAQQAKRYLRAAVQVGVELRSFYLALLVLCGTSLLLIDQGTVERAVELYALASRHPMAGNSRWFEDIAGRYIAAAAASLPPEAIAAAQERGRARDLHATVAELLVELGG